MAQSREAGKSLSTITRYRTEGSAFIWQVLDKKKSSVCSLCAGPRLALLVYFTGGMPQFLAD